MRTSSLDSLCCFLPPDPNNPPRYTEINDRLNAIDKRTRRKSITGKVYTVRYRIGSEHVTFYEYRDKAEFDLAQ